MTIEQLLALFPDLREYLLIDGSPVALPHDHDRPNPKYSAEMFRLQSPLRTCWYGSAGMDIAPCAFFGSYLMECILPQEGDNRVFRIAQPFDRRKIEGLVGGEVNVFFYTDAQYVIGRRSCKWCGHNFTADDDWPVLQVDFQCLKFKPHRDWPCAQIDIQGKCEALIYGLCAPEAIIVFIKTTDEDFEQTLVEKGMTIDIACHAGGMAGPGPRRLQNLGCRFALGQTPLAFVHGRGYLSPAGHYDNHEDASIIPFTTEPIHRLNWGFCGYGGCDLQRVNNAAAYSPSKLRKLLESLKDGAIRR
ncbi:MAG: hypothetical protein K9N49_00610 [Candidatus Marinimicrobia bacterium]|nr:hypothetical protein [Candidatus Neomarinimicrobiota bacterium]